MELLKEYLARSREIREFQLLTHRDLPSLRHAVFQQSRDNQQFAASDYNAKVKRAYQPYHGEPKNEP